MKKIVALVLITIMMLSLYSCSGEKTLTIEYTEKLSILEGSSGEMVELTDAASIKRITDNINSLTLSKKGRDNVDGFSYSIAWIDEDGKRVDSVRIFGQGEVSYGGKLYDVTDGRVDVDYLKGLFLRES